MFRTALPFGYLAQALLLLAGAVVAARLLWRGGRHADPRGLRRGGLVVALLAGWLLAAAMQPTVDDWNPTPVAADSLLGRWTDDGRVLDLRRGGTYRLGAEGAPAAGGRWRVADWSVTMTDSASGRASEWRVVRAGGELRILDEPGEEPDLWTGTLGFRRAAPVAP